MVPARSAGVTAAIAACLGALLAVTLRVSNAARFSLLRLSRLPYLSDPKLEAKASSSFECRHPHAWHCSLQSLWRPRDTQERRCDIVEGVEGLIGNTKLVRIRSLSHATHCEVSPRCIREQLEALVPFQSERADTAGPCRCWAKQSSCSLEVASRTGWHLEF